MRRLASLRRERRSRRTALSRRWGSAVGKVHLRVALDWVGLGDGHTFGIKTHKKNIVLQYIGRGLASGISACGPMPAPAYRQGEDHVEQRPSTTRLVAFSPVG